MKGWRDDLLGYARVSTPTLAIVRYRHSKPFKWSRDGLLVRAPDSWPNGCEFESRQEQRENFSSPELTLCADSYSVSVPPPPTPVLPQWHVKDPGHAAKSASGRLRLYTHTPLTQRSRSGLTMPLYRHSVGTYPETSSHAACQGTFGHSRLSSLGHCGQILA